MEQTVSPYEQFSASLFVILHHTVNQSLVVFHRHVHCCLDWWAVPTGQTHDPSKLPELTFIVRFVKPISICPCSGICCPPT
jgi:hypothetical protein